MASQTATANGLVTNPTASEAMCIYAFDVLVEHFTGNPAPAPQFQEAKCPLFVTWMKEASSDPSELRLRGCIGTLSPLHILQGIKDYALTSALRDRRFNPVVWKEVPRLACTVSLLTNYEDAEHYLDWEIGTHGLIIAFDCPEGSGYFTATYLPEIAAQEGWSHEECIESLMRKSGYRGPIAPQVKQAMKVTKYQSTKISITYRDYVNMTAARQNGGSAS